MSAWGDVILGLAGIGMVLVFRRDKLPDLVQRSGMAIGLLMIALAITAVRSFFFPVLLCVVGTSCQWEMIKALQHGGYKPVVGTSIAFILLLYPVYHFTSIFGVIVFYLLLSFANLVGYVCRKERSLNDAMASNFVLLYPGLGFLFAVLLNEIPNEGLASLGFAAAILVPSVSDIFAFVAGKSFGRIPLAPHVSPKKTVEGAAGGVVGGGLAMLALGALSPLWGVETLPFWQYLLGGVMISVCGQIGDLTASGLKRTVGIKDFSHILGSHGGVMDRMDSILVGFVISYLIIAAFYHIA